MGRARCDEELAEALGVGADLVAATRGPEDVMKEGRALVFTPEGAERVAEALGVFLPPGKKEGAEPAEVELTVLKRCRNPIWVYAMAPGEEEPVPVRVRKNFGLRRGVRLRAVRRDGVWVACYSSLRGRGE